jgi:hypothetical protein
MLDKVAIIQLVIRNVKVISHNTPCALILRIGIRVSHPHDVNQNCYMVAVSMHGLYFILHLEGVILCIVNDRDHGIVRKTCKAYSELIVLPFSNKTVLHKSFQFWFQVAYQFV